MKILLISHRADNDGKLSGDICFHYLSKNKDNSITSIGWDYGDPTPSVDGFEAIWMVDISIEALMSDLKIASGLVWIDHHKSAIEKWHKFWSEMNMPVSGLRIDGIAACRLTWSFFNGVTVLPEHEASKMPGEPDGVFLVGLRDVWKHTGTEWEGVCNLLHLGLIARPDDICLIWGGGASDQDRIDDLVGGGMVIQAYSDNLMAEHQDRAAHVACLFGLRFLVLNTPTRGSMAIDSKSRALHSKGVDHDALLVWCHTGLGHVAVSMYHADHRKDLDLSVIAQAMGGGGHRGACGFRTTLANMNTYLTAQ